MQIIKIDEIINFYIDNQAFLIYNRLCTEFIAETPKKAGQLFRNGKDEVYGKSIINE